MNTKLIVSSICWAFSLIMLSFATNRANFPLLIAEFSIAFASYLYLCKQNEVSKQNIAYLLWASILLRFVIVFAFPFFSDDIYRFWWDGKLITQGINPFDSVPSYFIDNQVFTNDFDKFIFTKLNSPDYYSVYPPVCQVVFTFSYWLSPKSIYGAAVVIKLCLFACEAGTIFLLKKILGNLNKPKYFFLIYALNPLIIIELCGNAHFEAAMLFFFAACLFVLTKPNKQNNIALETKHLLSRFFATQFQHISYKKVILTAFFLALSVASKLLTLLFLPFIVKNLGLKKGLIFGVSTLFFLVLFFLPFYNATFFAHFNNSLNLYFQKFEFNASLYYVLRSIGKWYFGYSPTILISRVLASCTLLTLTYFFFKKGDFFRQIFFFFTCYIFFQSTVHPWYLSTLLLLSVFVPFRFGVIWSALIMLTYSHYWNNIYQENYWFIAFEYAILLGLIYLEKQKLQLL